LRRGWRTHGWRDGRAHRAVADVGDLVAAVALPLGEESRNVTDLTVETDVTNETEETEVTNVTDVTDVTDAADAADATET
jgi:hypothetical protein